VYAVNIHFLVAASSPLITTTNSNNGNGLIFQDLNFMKTKNISDLKDSDNGV
jgi:hypothetical protein